MKLRLLTAVPSAAFALPLAAQSAPPRVAAAATSSTLPDPQKPGHYALDKLYHGDLAFYAGGMRQPIWESPVRGSGSRPVAGGGCTRENQGLLIPPPLDHLVPGQAAWIVAASQSRVSDTGSPDWGIIRTDTYRDWKAWAALPGLWAGK
jgi:hypothetical protein